MENVKNLDGVRNLLFDLGGVIMNLRRENCVEALEQLGLKEADEMLGLYCQTGPFMQFRAEIRRRIGCEVSDAEMDDAFNRFLLGIPVERLRALESLRKQYKIYMLSNTNAIMFDSKIKTDFQIDGKNREDYFDGMCLSYEEGCAKPDPQIFHNVLDKFGIKAEETLFFDDSQANLEAAARLGFRTWLVEPGTEFMEAFK